MIPDRQYCAERVRWYERQIAAVRRQRARAFMGSNGLWYAAEEDEEGFHAQGIGRHGTREDALTHWRSLRDEYLACLEHELELAKRALGEATQSIVAGA